MRFHTTGIKAATFGGGVICSRVAVVVAVVVAVAVVAVLLGVSLGGCGGPQSTAPRPPACPQFAQGASPAGEYPPERFLVGRGSASGVWSAEKGEEQARAQALNDIVSQLSANVSSELQVSQSESSLGGRQRQARSEVRETVQVDTSMVLQGARVVARCFDPAATTAYALAVVDRGELAQRVTASIVAANSRGASEAEMGVRFEGEGRMIEAIAHARSTLAAAEEVERLTAVLLAVGGAEAVSPFAPVAKAKAGLERLRVRARVRLVVMDPEGMVRESIKGELARIGIPLATDAAGAAGTEEVVVLEVRGRVEHAGSSQSGRLVAVRLRASVEVVRAESGAVVGSVTRQEKGGGGSENTARGQAAKALAKTIAPEVARLVREELEQGGSSAASSPE
ncbi:MAG: LPP20 family lipoprotein [Pseudomonadota bacterium]